MRRQPEGALYNQDMIEIRVVAAPNDVYDHTSPFASVVRFEVKRANGYNLADIECPSFDAIDDVAAAIGKVVENELRKRLVTTLTPHRDWLDEQEATRQRGLLRARAWTDDR